MTLDQFLLILFFGLLIWFLLNAFKPKSRKVVNIPGPRGLPFVGNLLSVIGRGGNTTKNFIGFVASLGKLYGRRSKFLIGRTHHVILSDPNDIQKILSSNVHVSKPHMYTFFEEWIGVSIGTAKANGWWAVRKLLNPSFKYSVLEMFVPEIDFEASLCVKKLEEKAMEEPGKAFDVSSFMANLTLDIIGKTAMDVAINSQGGRKSEFAEALEGALALSTKRWLSPWLHPDIVWKLSSPGIKMKSHMNTIHKFTEKVISDRRKIRSELRTDQNGNLNYSATRKTMRAFLDTLLDLQEQTNCLSDTQIRSESTMLLSAGHDITATSLQWILARLGYHKDIQEKVHCELDTIFQGDLKRAVTSADLRSMEYLEMVIKETLRLHPTAPMFMREVEVPLDLDGGAVIKPGVTVMINVTAVHMDSEFFPSPEEFIPERFSPQESSSRHPFAYLPFSLGPRMCIGHKFAMIELKMVVAHILRRFTICGDVHPRDIATEYLAVVKPLQGIRVSFTPR